MINENELDFQIVNTHVPTNYFYTTGFKNDFVSNTMSGINVIVLSILF